MCARNRRNNSLYRSRSIGLSRVRIFANSWPSSRHQKRRSASLQEVGLRSPTRTYESEHLAALADLIALAKSTTESRSGIRVSGFRSRMRFSVRLAPRISASAHSASNALAYRGIPTCPPGASLGMSGFAAQNPVSTGGRGDVKMAVIQHAWPGWRQGSHVDSPEACGGAVAMATPLRRAAAWRRCSAATASGLGWTSPRSQRLTV